MTEALVDLQGLTHAAARVTSLEEARCDLALACVVLDQEARARDELRRVRALNPALTFCRSHAPPAVRLQLNLEEQVVLGEVPPFPELTASAARQTGLD